MMLPTAGARIKCLETIIEGLNPGDKATIEKIIRSQKDLLKHLEDELRGFNRLQNAIDKLRTAKGKKLCDALRKTIEEEKGKLIGHAKEIKQRWGLDALKELPEEILKILPKSIFK